MNAPQTHSAAPDSTIEPIWARLYGEPLLKLPSDLYIPPDALEIFLDAFEGPLDLLLYLIRRQNFNILDIPLATLTQQYLDYVEQIRRHNLELASEYLLMAAMLIEIKSRLLLPRPPSAETLEPADPRAELVRRLQEYEQIKSGALQLVQLPQVERDFWLTHVVHERKPNQRYAQIAVHDLQSAWQDIAQRAKLNQKHHISHEALSVREHMSMLLRRLQDQRFIEFCQLFDIHLGLPGVVVTFIAMLELAKEQLIDITQASAYAPIYVRLGYRSHATSD